MMTAKSNNLMNWNGCLKTEKEAAEIEAYAKMIKEANDKKMLLIKNISLFNPTLKKLSPNPVENPKSEDWHSVKGQFGWIEIKNRVIPYLIRSGEKYVSQKMAEMKLFNSFHSVFTNEVFDCYRIKISQATKTEAALLNEINFRHCDNYYGLENFVEGSPLNRLQDVIEKSEFLEFCCERLIRQNTSNSMRCGYVKIGNENCVPYVCMNEKAYVPLFYFEVESDYLEQRSLDLEGWDLAYLKFACKIQDIKKDVFDQDKISVVELDLAKKFFLPGTSFVKCWQFENEVDHLIKETVDIMSPPVNHKTVNHVIIAGDNTRKQPIVGRYQNNVSNTFSAIQTTIQNFDNRNQDTTNYQNPRNVSFNRSTPTYLNYYNYSNWTNTNGTSLSYASTPNTIKTNNTYYNNAYRLHTIQIGNQFLNYCVNIDPYEGKSLLVTLEEVSIFFFKTSLESTRTAVNRMRLKIFQPNQHQLQVLQKYNIIGTCGMIRTDRLRDNLPQLKYILNALQAPHLYNTNGLF